jgi:uncharacterized protein YodC (DUF2158 family)
MKLGDVVKLKSGGPKMTLNYKTQTQTPPVGVRWGCVWFGVDDNAPLQAGVFAEEALNLTKPDAVPIGLDQV